MILLLLYKSECDIKLTSIISREVCSSASSREAPVFEASPFIISVEIPNSTSSREDVDFEAPPFFRGQNMINRTIPKTKTPTTMPIVTPIENVVFGGSNR